MEYETACCHAPFWIPCVVTAAFFAALSFQLVFTLTFVCLFCVGLPSLYVWPPPTPSFFLRQALSAKRTTLRQRVKSVQWRGACAITPFTSTAFRVG